MTDSDTSSSSSSSGSARITVSMNVMLSSVKTETQELSSSNPVGDDMLLIKN